MVVYPFFTDQFLTKGNLRRLYFSLSAINFIEILKHSITILQLSEYTQSILIDLLNEELTEEQQHLYVTNLWMYMNYHPTNEFPVNLETVFHIIGFANKGNATKTLENNFIKDEDYKIIKSTNKINEECLLVRSDKHYSNTKKQTNRGGHRSGQIFRHGQS